MFYPLKPHQNFVAPLIVHSEVVPNAEVPLCDMEKRRGTDGMSA